MKKKLLTIKEAADYLGVTYWVVRRLVQENKVKFIKAGNSYYLNAKSLMEYTGCEEDD